MSLMRGSEEKANTINVQNDRHIVAIIINISLTSGEMTPACGKVNLTSSCVHATLAGEMMHVKVLADQGFSNLNVHKNHRGPC